MARQFREDKTAAKAVADKEKEERLAQEQVAFEKEKQQRLQKERINTE